MTILETNRLLLVCGDVLCLEQALLGRQMLAKHLQIHLPETKSHGHRMYLEFALKQLYANSAELGWRVYFPILKSERILVGTCGFKGPPNEKNEVEIGYEINRQYQNQGLATEIAGALANNAFSTDPGITVLAYTRPQGNASAHVLLKCGFMREMHPENPGNDWLWKWKKTNRESDSRF